MDLQGCKQKAFLAVGLGLGFMAIPAVILLVYALVAGGWWLIPTLIASVMLVLPAALFSWLGLRDEERPVQLDETLERRVLQVATAHDGELTATELAMNTQQLRIEEAREVLERFETMGVTRSRVGHQGEMRYAFPQLKESMDAEDDFMRRLEEENPRSVLDFDVEADERQREEEEYRTEPAPRRRDD